MRPQFKTISGLLSFGILCVCAGLTQAQIVEYEFTGTRFSGPGRFGTTVYGVITLDVGAAPNVLFDLSYLCPSGGSAEQGLWHDGGFTINGITDTGIVAGTLLGGQTTFVDLDAPCSTLGETYIHSRSTVAGGLVVIALDTEVRATGFGDGFASVPNPWDPFASTYRVIQIVDNNQIAKFRLDSFTIIPSTIIIDGCDTGVEDFDFHGDSASSLIDACAVGARNHGQYVRCVAKLTTEFQRAGLISDGEKDAIMDCAAASSIGKN